MTGANDRRPLVELISEMHGEEIVEEIPVHDEVKCILLA